MGQVGMAIVAIQFPITKDSWRWVLLLSATLVVVGLVVLAAVPESPGWLASPRRQTPGKSSTPVSEVFRPLCSG
jgi:hypothetical protein